MPTDVNKEKKFYKLNVKNRSVCMAYCKLSDKCMSDLLKTFFITLNIKFLSLIY